MPGITSDVPISIQQAAQQLIASSAPQQGTVRHILTECGQGTRERVINLEDTPPRCMQETQTEDLVPSSSLTNEYYIHTHIFSERK